MMGHTAKKYDINMTNYHNQTPTLLYFTVPNDGYYFILANIHFSANSSGYRMISYFDGDNNVYSTSEYRAAANGSPTGIQLITPYFLKGNNYQLRGYQNSGANLTVTGWLIMQRITS